jgi:glucosamine-6-phosphate deaminase
MIDHPLRQTTVSVFDDKPSMGQAAAATGGELVRRAIAERGEAFVIVATGASQFEFLEAFVREDIDWSKVTMFHLDEYVGLDESHPASFRGYLKERFASKVPLKETHFVDGEADDPAAECRRLGEAIGRVTIDAAFVGVGENGHLAFNDPPADFETTEPFIVVDLDEACRNQQVGEGWFASIDEVPRQAISMSIREILRARAIVVTCPDRRKAEAVRDTLEGPVTPDVPASVLRRHPECRFFLDRGSASLLPS